MPDRGQSEIVAFATVFGIIMLSITLVSASGYMGLQNAQHHQQVTNGQQSMTVLADNVAAVTQDGVPRRSTQLDLGDGTLSVTDTVEITVSGAAVADPAQNFSFTLTTTPIVYETRESQVVYSTGAIVRVDRGNAVPYRDPDFVLTNESVVLPLVRTYPRDQQTVGSSTVSVDTERADSELRRANTTAYDLTLTITSPRADAWLASLDSSPATDCSRAGSTVSCDLTTQRVFVTVAHVGVSLR